MGRIVFYKYIEMRREGKGRGRHEGRGARKGREPAHKLLLETSSSFAFHFRKLQGSDPDNLYLTIKIINILPVYIILSLFGR